MSKFYVLKNSKGEYAAHKGPTVWTADKRKAHVYTEKQTPRDMWKTVKIRGEAVTTEDW